MTRNPIAALVGIILVLGSLAPGAAHALCEDDFHSSAEVINCHVDGALGYVARFEVDKAHYELALASDGLLFMDAPIDAASLARMQLATAVVHWLSDGATLSAQAFDRAFAVHPPIEAATLGDAVLSLRGVVVEGQIHQARLERLGGGDVEVLLAPGGPSAAVDGQALTEGVPRRFRAGEHFAQVKGVDGRWTGRWVVVAAGGEGAASGPVWLVTRPAPATILDGVYLDGASQASLSALDAEQASWHRGQRAMFGVAGGFAVAAGAAAALGYSADSAYVDKGCDDNWEAFHEIGCVPLWQRGRTATGAALSLSGAAVVTGGAAFLAPRLSARATAKGEAALWGRTVAWRVSPAQRGLSLGVTF